MFKSILPVAGHMTYGIGFIGAGKMATAMIEGIVAKGLYKKEEVVACCRSESTKQRMEGLGIDCYLDPKPVFKQCDTIVIAVKPNQIKDILTTNSEANSSKKLLISVAAGVKIPTLESYVPDSKIVRVMPNVCSTVLEGTSSYTLGTKTTAEDGLRVKAILDAIGFSFEIPEEDIDAVTGMSGSSPAFLFMVIDAMTDAGVELGLPKDLSRKLAAQTMLGSAKTVLETGREPEELKQSVCSPGGTTIEGVKVLDDLKMKDAFKAAIKASAEKSKRMGGN